MGHKLAEARTPLTEAAAALEAELRRFDELAALTHEIPLDSEENFGRAAQAMQQAAACQERTATLVRLLVDAMNRAHDAQQVSAVRLLDRAGLLKARTEVLEQLLDRFRALGLEAREVQALVGVAHERGAAGDLPGALSALSRARESIDALADAAESLSADAHAVGIVDIAREAGSLRARLLSAREQLGNQQPAPPKPH